MKIYSVNFLEQPMGDTKWSKACYQSRLKEPQYLHLFFHSFVWIFHYFQSQYGQHENGQIWSMKQLIRLQLPKRKMFIVMKINRYVKGRRYDMVRLSVLLICALEFSSNAGKYGPEKLQIRTFFNNCLN